MNTPIGGTLKIHAWGGLGSQLFALSLATNTRQASPRRKIQIVLHSSGVTKRNPEVSILYPEFEYVIVDDFESSKLSDLSQTNVLIRRVLVKLIGRVAAFSGLLARENGFGSTRIKPWTMSVRGHYFHRHIENEFIIDLKKRLEMNSNSLNLTLSKRDENVLHYRLGDLVDLISKRPVEDEVLVRLLDRIGHHKDLLILSDSPNIAVERLQSVNISGRVRTESLSTIETLLVASDSPLFIGTSSKISYWIVLIRLAINPSSINYLPKNDKDIMKILSEAENLIHYYD